MPQLPPETKNAAALELLDQKVERAYAETGPFAAEDATIAKLERDLFVWEHDTSGAYKRDRLGKDLIPQLTDRFTTPKSIEKVDPKDKSTMFLMISIGQLDRANDDAGHDTGDKGLRSEAEAAELAVRQNLRAVINRENPDLSYEDATALITNSYEIYRYSGSDFIVTLKDPTFTEAFQAAITSGINTHNVAFSEDTYPLPVSCVSMNLEDVRSIYHKSREKTPDEDINIRDVMEIITQTLETRSTIENLQRSAQFLRDVASRGDVPKAKDIYERYIQKMWGANIADIDDLLTLDEVGATTRAHKVIVDRLPAKQEHMDATTARERALQEVILSRIISLELLSQPGPVVQLEQDPNAKPVDASLYAGFVPKTKGRQHIAQLIAQLQERQANPDADPEKELRLKEIEHLQLLIEKSKMDELTGLPNRANFYADFEADLRARKERQVLFIDMGFLKFMNQNGGRDLGNYALKQSAQIFEKALEDEGIAGGKAYRYAGDEFVFLLPPGPETLQKITTRINKLRQELGPIQPTQNSDAKYRPMSLTFNYGVADTSLANDAYYTLENKGLLNKEDQKPTAGQPESNRHINFMAELQTRTADLGVAEQKAYERLITLMELARNAEGPDAEWLKFFHKFSAKAVFNMSLDQIKELSATLDEFGKGPTADQQRQIELQKFVHEKMLQGYASKAENNAKADVALHNTVLFALLSEQRQKVQALHAAARGSAQADYYWTQLTWYNQALQKLESPAETKPVPKSET